MLNNIILKVASVCNVQCQYCYVERTRNWRNTARLMSLDVLEAAIRRVAEYCETTGNVDRFVFYWHGGEPLIAGPGFFEEASKLQEKYMPGNVAKANTIQTNGVLLNKEWVDLIKKLDYGICVSLDGPAVINDVRRLTKNGDGTYEYVQNALTLLRDEDYPVSILAVITPEALRHGRQIYRHFRELGCEWMDFMYPMCNAIHNTLGQPIEPAKWGEFYADVFDAWMDEGNPCVYIRQLHDWCMLILGGKTAMCSSQSDCSYVLTVNTDGNIYVCDDVMPYCDSHLGDIFSHPLWEIAQKEQLRRLADRSTLYGDGCLACDYLPVCQGGCTLFRARSRNDFSSKHYFCQAQRISIDHIRKRLGQEIGVAPDFRRPQLAEVIRNPM